MAWQDGLTLGGAPVAHLHVSTTAPVATVAVKLSDVDPTSGVSCLITKGSLNLTHRESHVTPSAVVPGEVYEVRISLLECAYTLLPGHRLRGSSPLLVPLPAVSWPPGFWLGARWNRLVETVKTRKTREKTGVNGRGTA